jgi:hypothetical protein
VSGVATGLKPKTSYTVRLDGPAGQVIGTVTSDENGDLDGQVTVPGSMIPGGHTIDLTGDNQAGEATDVTQPVYVPASDNDADGDGIADSNDSCPGAVNSGHDDDQDGVDDTCDPLIGQPPPASTGSPGSGGQTNPPPATGGSIQTGTGNTPAGVTADPNSTANLQPATQTTPVDNNAVGLANLYSPQLKALPIVKAAPARVLGARASNPLAAVSKPIKAGDASQPLKQGVPFRKLPVISWLRWLVLPIICWLLLVIIYLLGRSLGKGVVAGRRV